MVSFQESEETTDLCLRISFLKLFKGSIPEPRYFLLRDRNLLTCSLFNHFEDLFCTF